MPIAEPEGPLQATVFGSHRERHQRREFLRPAASLSALRIINNFHAGSTTSTQLQRLTSCGVYGAHKISPRAAVAASSIPEAGERKPEAGSISSTDPPSRSPSCTRAANFGA